MISLRSDSPTADELEAIVNALEARLKSAEESLGHEVSGMLLTIPPLSGHC